MNKDPLKFIRSDFAELIPYLAVDSSEEIAKTLDISAGSIIKLNANENPYPPISAVREAIAGASINTYPDPKQSLLRDTIGSFLSVNPEQIVAGSGSDDLIDIVIRLVEPKASVTAVPTFGMYKFLSNTTGINHIAITRNENFEVDIPEIRKAVKNGANLILLASPNNPTGNSLSMEEVIELAELDAMIVVDEAYAEFSGFSVIPLIEEYPNLIVLRTFSKWAGLAGLRIGYSISHSEIAKRMMAIKQPYNVSTIAEAAACAAIRHRDVGLRSVNLLVLERERLSTKLSEFSIFKVFPSDANFVLVKVVDKKAEDVVKFLWERGILVRYYDMPELSGMIRISAGLPEQTDALLKALQEFEGNHV
jgi:histidinol-phosphate aminotransferase